MIDRSHEITPIRAVSRLAPLAPVRISLKEHLSAQGIQAPDFENPDVKSSVRDSRRGTGKGAHLTSMILLSLALFVSISVIGLLWSTERVGANVSMIIEDVKLDKTSEDWLVNVTGIICFRGSETNLIKNVKVWVDFGHVMVLVNRVNITYLPYESTFLTYGKIDRSIDFHRIILTAKYPHFNHQITINEMDLEIIHDDGKGEKTDKTDVIISKYV